MIISLGIFVLLTFSEMLHHWPFFDESHAWMLARNLDFSGIIDLLRNEGHPILWFLIIMPFAKNNLFFPHAMYIENYIFCLLALAVMWLKSPFETFYKIIITFSSIFMVYYSIIARCYSVGILGMFILLAMYENKIKKPVLYSILIGLTAHTNLLCAINASYLGIIFIYQLFKNNEVRLKDKILSVLILFGFVFAWLYPYINSIGMSYNNEALKPGLSVFCWFFFSTSYDILLFSCYASLFAAIFFLAKDIVTKGFLLYSSTLIFIFMKFFYSLAPHHYVFLFVNLIFAFWLFCINKKNKQHYLVLYLLFVLLFMFPIKEKLSYLYQKPLTPIIRYIDKTNISDKLYINFHNNDLAAIIPYIKDTSIFPQRTFVKPEDIQDGYYLTEEILQQYPIVYKHRFYRIYRIKN